MAGQRRRAVDGGSVAFSLMAAPGHLLRRAQQVAIELYFAEVGRRRLTPRQFALLLTVAQRPGISQIDLVARTGIDRSTVADTVRRLARRGLLRRRRTRRDARANALHVTAAGARLLAEVAPAVTRAQARILAPIAAGERRTLVRLLRQLVAATRQD
jgi:DNA-binding MarR family transcriptional regulator